MTVPKHRDTKIPRRNQQISATEVRLIGPDGQQIGVLSLSQALDLANEADLDLVEISPDATPPVCKIFDWSKDQYLTDKEQRAAKRRQQAVQEVKEIQLRPGISDHDLGVRAQSTKRFLEKGAKVRVVIILIGRIAATHFDVCNRGLAEMQFSKQLVDMYDLARHPVS